MNVGSLFAGIGGFDLGLERAGMRTLWQVESEPFRRAVLARHFPDAKRYEDVREVGAHNLERVDVICGGFPCQDLSLAGKGAGIDGARSGLWSEYARIVGELRPRYVIVENVPALLGRGLGRVLGDLAACGYDAEWDCIPASAFGAPHRRDRVWLIAYPQRDDLRVESTGQSGGDLASISGNNGTPRALADPQQPGLEGFGTDAGQPQVSESRDGRSLAHSRRGGWTQELPEPINSAEGSGEARHGEPAPNPQGRRDLPRVAARAGGISRSGERSGTHPDPDSRRLEISGEQDGGPIGPEQQAPFGNDADGLRSPVADTEVEPIGTGLREDEPRGQRGGRPGDGGGARDLAHADGRGRTQPQSRTQADQNGYADVGVRHEHDGAPSYWLAEPNMGRVADGVPARVDRLAALGDALVPQIAEFIGNRILSYERDELAA